MGLDAVIYIPSFINFGFSDSKAAESLDTLTAWRSHKPAFILLQNKDRVSK
jgi:hypothetical protein